MREIQSIRDFIWIDDVIDSMIRVIKKQPGKILNIGSGKSYSIKDVIKIAIKSSGINKKKIIGKKKLKKKSTILLNINLAKKILQWRPKVTLKEGFEIIFKKVDFPAPLGPITGNRAEYGLMLPIIKAIKKHPKLTYKLIVSGAHLDSYSGNGIHLLSRFNLRFIQKYQLNLKCPRKYLLLNLLS